MPLFAAVAAMERASISATEDICPFWTLEPSLLGKFLVECLMEKALFEGVSPAPKQGPQKQVFTTTPASMKREMEPFLTSSAYTGMEAGYTLMVKASLPMSLPFKISAAAQRFSKPPPAQPAMIP